MLKKICISLGLAALFSVFMLDPALADQPVDWGITMQDAASPSAERIHSFHNGLLYVIFGTGLFVMALLIWVMIRFNKRANPTPSTVTHNVLLEIIWTVFPVVILIVIAVPSFNLLYYVDRTENAEMTLKVTGYQWYWGYDYPDHGDINFQAYIVPESEINAEAGQVRLLSTDNPVVLPIDTNIQIDIAAADVLHAWAVPALGVKMDAVPGRLNSTWFRINKPGTYFGQCSELCGKDHAYMPIEIKAVPKDEFAQWVIAQGGTMPVIEDHADESAALTDETSTTMTTKEETVPDTSQDAGEQPEKTSAASEEHPEGVE